MTYESSPLAPSNFCHMKTSAPDCPRSGKPTINTVAPPPPKVETLCLATPLATPIPAFSHEDYPPHVSNTQTARDARRPLKENSGKWAPLPEKLRFSSLRNVDAASAAEDSSILAPLPPPTCRPNRMPLPLYAPVGSHLSQAPINTSTPGKSPLTLPNKLKKPFGSTTNDMPSLSSPTTNDHRRVHFLDSIQSEPP